MDTYRSDEEREVALDDEERQVLPDQPSAERPASNDDRLLDERPPHW